MEDCVKAAQTPCMLGCCSTRMTLVNKKSPQHDQTTSTRHNKKENPGREDCRSGSCLVHVAGLRSRLIVYVAIQCASLVPAYTTTSNNSSYSALASTLQVHCKQVHGNNPTTTKTSLINTPRLSTPYLAFCALALRLQCIVHPCHGWRYSPPLLLMLLLACCVLVSIDLGC